MTAAPGVACRSCGATNLQPFLDLGSTPLADALVRPEWLDDPQYREGFFPLEVAFCPDCTLVQILEEVPAEKLFVENYLYFSSFSDHLLRHSREHALGLVESRGLDDTSLVVELASNDGYLLKNFVEAGIPVLGIDPAPEPAAAAIEAGVPTLVEFFGTALAEKLVGEGKRANVIIANNVMAHVPDLNGFVEGMATLLADDGVITVENPCVRDLVDHGEFDTIYHEHFCYYSCHSVDALVRRHGMYLNHVDYFPDLHGGTLRWWISKSDHRTPECEAWLADEEDRGLTQFAYYEAFGQRVEQIRDDLLALLRSLKADGKTIAAYGAAAKGSTLVNYCGIDTELVDFVVDRNVHKQGLLMPGVHQPIRGVEALLEDQPDYTLLLAWNFATEIRAQQAEYEAQGGRFIRPVPSPEVLA
ncbi:MAG: class I SAM-dependent methyltransferase [Acidimicrobiia bacterium]